jgi:hypothetical protein
MQHKPTPPLEIAPDHWIEPPIYAKSNAPAPQHVRDANHDAGIQINEHKDTFIRVCLESLFTDEEVGEAMLKHMNQPQSYIPALLSKLDAGKFKLLLRADHTPILIIPSHHHPESKKQTGHIRHTGHTLTLAYDDKWIGTMTVEYNDGRINIDMTTRQDAPEP